MKTLLQKVFGKRKHTPLVSSKPRSHAHARRLHLEPLEERTLLAANPDILFDISSIQSYATDGPRFGNEMDPPGILAPSISISHDDFLTQYGNSSAWMEMNASSSEKQATLTATLEAKIGSSGNPYNESYIVFYLSVWVRGDGYIPYHAVNEQTGSITTSRTDVPWFTDSGVNCTGDLWGDWDFYLSGGLRLYSGGGQSIPNTKSTFSTDNSTDKRLLGPRVKVYNGEVYQQVWLQTVGCQVSP